MDKCDVTGAMNEPRWFTNLHGLLAYWQLALREMWVIPDMGSAKIMPRKQPSSDVAGHFSYVKAFSLVIVDGGMQE